MRFYHYALLLSISLTTAAASAQEVPPPANVPAPPPAAPQAPPPVPAPTKSAPYGNGLQIDLSPDGAKYIRFITFHQIWTRYTQNNSGTLRAPGKPQEGQFDVGIRRSRLILLAQLNPRFLIYTHFAVNNQNAVSGGVAPGTDGKKPQFFILEAVTDYKVFKYLNLGGGLHYNNGISRLTSPSTSTILPLDLPLVNFPTVDQIDQFARWLGVYARGRIGKFNYRLAVDEAFLTNLSSTPATLTTNVAEYNPRNTSHVYQGYFNYNFLEPEANLLPYFTGTYLGTKRVLSVGTGFLYNQDGMYSRPAPNPAPLPADPFAIPTSQHDINIFGADVFYDAPLDTARGTALTVYGAYYHSDFGPNYVRFVGALNPGYGPDARRGNAIPQSGTGSSEYVQVGYLLPKKLLGPKARLQPYLTYLHSSYAGLRDASGDRKQVHVPNVGVNVLLDGHHAKLTLDYRHRPDFTDVNHVKYRPELTMQMQVYL